MDKMIMIDRNELSEVFSRVIKKNPVKKILGDAPELMLFAIMLSVEMERELFEEGK